MTELERIRDQFQRSFDGESWLGPPHREILRGIAHERAAARPLGNAHSIWEILLHVTSTALLEAITTLDPARLDEPVLEGFSSFYVTLHGLIQHDCYHFGQIGVLKKG